MLYRGGKAPADGRWPDRRLGNHRHDHGRDRAMSNQELIMQVEENRRAVEEDDDWQAWVQGCNDGSHASVRSWNEARRSGRVQQVNARRGRTR